MLPSKPFMRRIVLFAALLLLGGLASWLLREPRPPAPPPAASTPAAGAPPAAAPAVSQPDGAAGARVAVTPDGAGRVLLTGRVVDLPLDPASGAATPAAGLTVRLKLSTTSFWDNQAPVASTVTGAGGDFRHEWPDPGQRPLFLEAETASDAGFRYSHWTLRLEDGAPNQVSALLQRVPHGELHGVTRDAAGRPLAAVKLAFGGDGPNGSRETISDHDGRFVIPSFPELSFASAEKDGYVLLEALMPRPLPAGGYEPMEVLLAGRGKMRLSARDGDGAPIAGVQFQVNVSSAERAGHSPNGWTNSPRRDLVGQTDASGACVIEGVWSDLKLWVAFSHHGIHRRTERRQDARLVIGENGEAGVPIVVPAGRTLDLEVLIPALLRVHGSVVNGRGEAVPRPEVSFRSLDHWDGAPQALFVSTTGDEQGRFEMAVPALRPLGPVLVSATEATAGFLAAFEQIGSVLLDLQGQSSGAVEARIVLEDLSSIGGRVLDAAGRGVPARIRAVPVPAELPGGRARHGLRLSTDAGADGVFLFHRIPAGVYDLEIDGRGYAVQWLRGVAAGTTDLEIRLERPEQVRVTVEVASVFGELDAIIVLQARLQAHEAPPADAPELAKNAVYTAPRGWPLGAAALWYGAQGYSDALGSTLFSSWPVRENPTTLELDEGWYWLGAKGRDTEGRLYFPMGTGLVHVSPGEYRLRFELTPAVRLEGRVVAAELDPLWHVALADDSGELLAVDVRRRDYGALAELGSDGSFLLPMVPAGRWRLRVGRPDQLANGSFIHEEPLAVRAGGMPMLNVVVAR